jgi:hypothetical protein
LNLPLAFWNHLDSKKKFRDTTNKFLISKIRGAIHNGSIETLKTEDDDV